MSKSHNTIPTVSPKERALLVSVSETQFASSGGVLPPENTLYDDEAFKTFFGRDYNLKFSGFKYSEQRENVAGPKGEGSSGQLLFIRTKTEPERLTPFREYEEKRLHGWSNVLTFANFNEEYGFPLSQNYILGTGTQGIATVPRWLVQYGWIDGMELMTTVKVREFLSDVPFPDWFTESDEPKPTPISWDLIGNQGSFPKCLHKEEIIKGQSDNSGIRIAAGENFLSGNSNQGAQIFPRTNHLGWQDYKIFTFKRVDGQFHGIEETFIAPLMPKPSYLKS